MPFLPEDLVLPRTVTLEFVNMLVDDVEIGSHRKFETYRYEVMVYSTLRGDIADLVELIYAGMHGGGELFDFPAGFSVSIPFSKVLYDNFAVKYFKPFSIGDKNVHSASIRFDAVVTREG